MNKEPKISIWTCFRFWQFWIGLLFLFLFLPVWPIQERNGYFDYYGVINGKTGESYYPEEIPEDVIKHWEYCNKTHTEFTWFNKFIIRQILFTG